MTDTAGEPEVAYHLLVESDEAGIAVRALHLLISDEAHEPDIRALAREAIELLEPSPNAIEGAGVQAAETAGAGEAMLTVPQMKILHTAVRLMLLDTQRDQEDERQLLRSILSRLPDDHAIRAIEIG